VLCDVLVPAGNRRAAGKLTKAALHESGADYALRIGGPLVESGFVRLPKQGPILTWRDVCEMQQPALDDWSLTMGDVASGEPVLVRVHDECLTGDTFHSIRCDCGEQLDVALARIAEEGRGVLLYLRAALRRPERESKPRASYHNVGRIARNGGTARFKNARRRVGSLQTWLLEE